MRNRQLVALGILWLALSAAALVYELKLQPQIVIQWETETEIDTAGFNLYRSDSPDGQPERLNGEPILSRGDPLTGAKYEFTDVQVRRDQVYYYHLEELEVDGIANRLDTIRAEAQGAQGWVVALAGVGIVVGAYLFITGAVVRRSPASAEGPREEGVETLVTGQIRVPMRNPELVWRPVDDELVIVRPSDGQIRVLNGVGALVWKLMDGHHSVGEIAGVVCDEYEVSLEQAEDDIRLFLEPLAEDGMVQWSP